MWGSIPHLITICVINPNRQIQITGKTGTGIVEAEKKLKKVEPQLKRKTTINQVTGKNGIGKRGGREKVQARRTSEEGRLKEKIQRLQRAGLKVV